MFGDPVKILLVKCHFDINQVGSICQRVAVAMRNGAYVGFPTSRWHSVSVCGFRKYGSKKATSLRRGGYCLQNYKWVPLAECLCHPGALPPSTSDFPDGEGNRQVTLWYAAREPPPTLSNCVALWFILEYFLIVKSDLFELPINYQ